MRSMSSYSRLLVLVLVAGIVLVPLVTVALGGFKTMGELEANPFGLPVQWHWENYLSALTGRRLWQSIVDGSLVVRAHPFSCAPWSYHRIPADLADEFASATVTIMKGDLNYRRLVGDLEWPSATPFDAVTRYFPGPVAAVRTLKCDVVVGVPDDERARLDATGERWRTSGTHALVQVSDR